jgi:GNAT superfamily N-acetyltransferase
MSGFDVRLATVNDSAVIGYHRARMFHEMGQISDHLFDAFKSRSGERVREMLESGEYVGWLAGTESDPDKIVAGAGVQLRRTLPHPAGEHAFAEGRQGLIINVFTEPEWRRQGLAALLFERIIQCRANKGSIASCYMLRNRAGLFIRNSDSCRPMR